MLSTISEQIKFYFHLHLYYHVALRRRYHRRRAFLRCLPYVRLTDLSRLSLIPGRRKEVDDIAYEVECQNITVKPGADVDIGRFS